MKCEKCQDVLSTVGESVVCGLCSKGFHFNCSIRETKWRNMTSDQKSKWNCYKCKNSSSGSLSSQDSSTAVGKEEEADPSIRALLLSMNTKLNTLEDVKKTVDGLSTSMSFLSNQYDDLLQELKEFKEANRELVKKVDILELQCKKKDEEVVNLTKRFNALEQYGRGNNLEIHGLSDEDHGCEDPNNVVRQAAQALGLQYNPAEVQACHRVPNRSEKSTQPDVFLIQFVSKATKAKWLQLGKKRKLYSKDIVGTGEGRVFFNENLTPFYRKLLYDTKKLASQKNYEFVWVINGHIKVRKNREARTTHVIAGYEDLKQIV